MQFKNRCPVCMKFFCCPTHKSTHLLKTHKVIPKKERPDLLLKMFQKKAEMILMKSQQYHEKSKAHEDVMGQNPNKIKRALKRTHSTMTRQILTASVTVLSQSRPIIIPIRKLSNNNLGEKKPQNDNTKVIISPCDSTTVKTSTPITGHLQDKNSDWNNMISSSTSKYMTPTSIDPLSAFKTPIGSARTIVTPIRGIMVKTSKYDSNDSNPSPFPNLVRSRRVTFSFSSQMSSANSSPLESVPEETKDKINIIEIDSCAKVKEQDKENAFVTDESASSVKGGGFFSCVTSIFCSAVHTLESTWKQSQNRRNISKRSRSPERIIQETIILSSPVPKRRCYPWDLRNNPIRARKPISKV